MTKRFLSWAKTPHQMMPVVRSGVIALVGSGLVFLCSFMISDQYESVAKILPLESRANSTLGNMAAVAATLGIALPGGDSSDTNYVEIIESRSQRELLLQTRFKYHAIKGRIPEARLTTATLGEYLHIQNLDSGVHLVGKVVKANRDLKTKILTISAETTSPELSQQLVSRVLELLENFIREKSQTRGGFKAAFAQARLVDARAQQEKAEVLLHAFLDRNRNFNTSADPGVRLHGNQLEMELRLRQQLVTTLSMNLEQALLEEKNDIPILNILEPGNLPINHSWPARGLFVVISFFILALGSTLWHFRDRLLMLLREETYFGRASAIRTEDG